MPLLLRNLVVSNLVLTECGVFVEFEVFSHVLGVDVEVDSVWIGQNEPLILVVDDWSHPDDPHWNRSRSDWTHVAARQITHQTLQGRTQDLVKSAHLWGATPTLKKHKHADTRRNGEHRGVLFFLGGGGIKPPTPPGSVRPFLPRPVFSRFIVNFGVCWDR